MSGHRKWTEIRETREWSPARHRAQRKFDRKLRWYARLRALKTWLGFE